MSLPNECGIGRGSDGASRPAILVVDGEPECCVVMKDVFEDLGYEVDTALDAATALSLARSRSYGAVLVDCYGVRPDGLALLEDIRTLIPRRAALIITADPADPRLKDALSDGVTAILRKPVDVFRLRKIIGKAADPAADVDTRLLPTLSFPENDLPRMVEGEIHRRTGQKVCGLKVARRGQRLVVSGKVRSYYLKQLVVHATLQATNGAAEVEFELEVTSR